VRINTGQIIVLDDKQDMVSVHCNQTTAVFHNQGFTLCNYMRVNPNIR